MALGPDLWRLRQLQTEVDAAGPRGGRQLRVAHRAVRVRAGRARRAQGGPAPPAAARRRASRRSASTRCRSAGVTCSNWFTLPYDDRKELMYAHGASGRKFAGRVLQVVTGSTGIDDFEWGVTLFAVHPDDLKEVVYTMRFDEASALYAEFGPFYTGHGRPARRGARRGRSRREPRSRTRQRSTSIVRPIVTPDRRTPPLLVALRRSCGRAPARGRRPPRRPGAGR